MQFVGMGAFVTMCGWHVSELLGKSCIVVNSMEGPCKYIFP